MICKATRQTAAVAVALLAQASCNFDWCKDVTVGCVDFNVECTPNVRDPEGMAGWLGRTKTDAPVSLLRADVRTGDNALGQLLAESYYHAFDKLESDASILPRVGVENSGAIRAECRTSLSAGRIRRKWLRQVIPFDNQIYSVALRTEELRRVFEHSVAGFQKAGNPPNPIPPGEFLQIFGATLDVDCNQQAEEMNSTGTIKTDGRRVQRVHIMRRDDATREDCVLEFAGGAPPNPCRGDFVWVAVNSFEYAGNDGYWTFRAVSAEEKEGGGGCDAGPCRPEKVSRGLLNFNIAAQYWAETYPDDKTAFPGEPAKRHNFVNCVLK